MGTKSLVGITSLGARYEHNQEKIFEYKAKLSKEQLFSLE
jgi:hypothetical protein